jgi:hypothetical protein
MASAKRKRDSEEPTNNAGSYSTAESDNANPEFAVMTVRVGSKASEPTKTELAAGWGPTHEDVNLPIDATGHRVKPCAGWNKMKKYKRFVSMFFSSSFDIFISHVQPSQGQ